MLRWLHVDRVAEVDVAERLATTDPEVISGKFEEADEHAVRWYADDCQRLCEETVELALGVDRTTWQKEDAHVGEPLRSLTVCTAQKAMRLMNDERDVAMRWSDLEGTDDCVMDALKEVSLLLGRVVAPDFNDGTRHPQTPWLSEARIVLVERRDALDVRPNV
jgi:hypothetical protein